MNKIIALSDTHNSTQRVEIPDGDILIFAGDFSYMGREGEIYDFMNWLGSQPHKHKLWIPGNHELGVEDFPYNTEVIDNETGATCIHDKEVEIEGIKIFGSAFTPEFNNWAYNLTERQSKMYWENAPTDIDILVTHGPPYKILDNGYNDGDNYGCPELLKYVERVKPKVHLFGHIHERGGDHIEKDGTHFYNVAVMNREYNIAHLATEILWQ